MGILNLSEKILKRYLKRKLSITIALIVTFLIVGGIGGSDSVILARDLRARNPEINDIIPDLGGPNKNISANGTEVINILNPDEKGISYNKFVDLNVGTGNGLIFNNSIKDGVSVIGGHVSKNTNLEKNATVILNEVTGNKCSNLNGSIEIFGEKADFILANENGINVNGATIINASGVTLTTGKVSANNSEINFGIHKGNVNLNGIKTSGDYFNILAKTIEIYGGISSVDGEKNPNITVIAGENNLVSKNDALEEVEVKFSKKSKSDKCGIYATELGAMYGNSIRLISTDSGVGVRHDGVIYSEDNIEINSQGDVVLKDVNSKGELKIAGKNLAIQDKSLNQKGEILGSGDIKITLSKDIINTGKICGNNLEIEANSIENTGTLQGGNNILLKAAENIANSGIITAKNNIKIDTNLYVSSGNKFSPFDGVGVVEGNNIVVMAEKSLANNGVLTSKENINLSSQGNIINNGIISVEKDAGIKGKNIYSNNLAAGGKLKVEGKVISKDLIVGNGIDIDGSLTIIGETRSNGELNIAGDLKVINGSTIIKNGILVDGGVDNFGSIYTGGDFSIIGNEVDFVSTGYIEVGKNLNINSKNVMTENITVGGNVKINSQENISSNGKLQAQEDIFLAGENVVEENIVTGGRLVINSSNTVISKDISTGGDLNISSNSFENLQNIIIGKDATIDAETILNSGKIHSQGKIGIVGNKVDNKGEVIGSKIGISGSVNNIGSFQSKGDINITDGKDLIINSGGKLLATGDIDISIANDITNDGMILGNGDINLKGKNIENSKGVTIWTTKNISMIADEKIHNGIESTIEAMGDISFKSREIENSAGTIKSGNEMELRADSLVNRSVIEEDFKIGDYTSAEAVTRWSQVAFYHLDRVHLEIPNIVDNSYVKNMANINSRNNMSIQGNDTDGKGNIINEAGTILASENLTVIGDVKNTSNQKKIPLEWLLEKINATLSWKTKLYGGANGNRGTKFKGNLKDALLNGYFSLNDDKYYSSLTQIENPVLGEILSAYLGAEWRSQNKPVSKDKWNRDGEMNYTAIGGEAKILAGNNLSHSGGSFINDGGKSGSNKNVSVSVGNESIEGVLSNGSINIGDINRIKEIDGVKQVHDVEMIAKGVTIDGVNIKAEKGNTAGSIAVAGTINPLIFINTPISENGVFRSATPKAEGVQSIYETNITFIKPEDFYGAKYLFNQIGNDKNKNSTVVGDAYYEYTLLTKMMQLGIGHQGSVTAENIKSLLDSDLELHKSLKLEIGKPLTPEQVNNLEKDIIWYVEMEVKGQKALVPQIYFSKNSRINIANSQGNGGSTTVKTGGSFISNSTEFSNINGNINADGNIIIKSEGDVANNSSGGISGGMSSKENNVVVAVGGDVNIIGGRIKGDNVLVSGENISIESTLGVGKNGNQIVSDRSRISGGNRIEMDIKNDVNIKGGSLTASRVQVKSNSGNVIVEDMHTISSSRLHSNRDEGNYTESVSLKAKSIPSNIEGSAINISSERDVTLKGSNMVTNDMLGEKEDKTSSSRGINIRAKGDINIIDGKDIAYEKISEKTTTREQKLRTVEWKEKEKKESLSKGSSIMTEGDLNIISGNDVKIQGSDLISLVDTNISAKNNVEIIDGRGSEEENSTERKYQVVGAMKSTSESSSSTSAGSTMFTVGDLNIISGNEIKIVNGNLKADGDTRLNAERDISIEAGENSFHKETSSLALGFYMSGYAGIGDATKEGEKKSYNLPTVNGSPVDGGPTAPLPTYPTGSGGTMLDPTAFGTVGVNVESYHGVTDKIKRNDSFINGNNILIATGEGVDIGGGNFKAENNIDVSGKSISTTKYSDSISTKERGFNIYLEDAFALESSLVDVANKMSSIINAGSEVDPVTAAIQSTGAVTTALFNDMIGGGNYVKTGSIIKISNSSMDSENTISMSGKNISLKTVEKDLNLMGVDISSENLSIASAGDINVGSATIREKFNKATIDGEFRFGQGGAVNVASGTGVGMNLGFHTSTDTLKGNTTTEKNSKISSKNISISSENGLNIKGGNVNGEGDVTLDIGKDVNIQSLNSNENSDKRFGSVGGRVGISIVSNTLVKGNISSAVGGGHIFSSEENTNISGITAGNSISANIAGDLNIEGGIIGSMNEGGSICVAGNINLRDVSAISKKGGADVVASAGQFRETGVTGHIADKLDKKVVTKSAIGAGNLVLNGDVTINGESNNISNINRNIADTQHIITNNSRKGGTFSVLIPIREGVYENHRTVWDN